MTSDGFLSFQTPTTVCSSPQFMPDNGDPITTIAVAPPRCSTTLIGGSLTSYKTPKSLIHQIRKLHIQTSNTDAYSLFPLKDGRSQLVDPCELFGKLEDADLFQRLNQATF